MTRHSHLLAVGSLMAIPGSCAPRHIGWHILARIRGHARRPGDGVVTKTVDAGGTDWDGKPCHRSEPADRSVLRRGHSAGDTLIVRIEKLETNRATAFSSTCYAPYTVDPASLATRVDRNAVPSRTGGSTGRRESSG